MSNKNSKQKLSETGLLLLVLIGMFGFFKYKWSSKKQPHTQVAVIETPQQTAVEVAPPIQAPQDPPTTEAPPAANTQVKYEEVTASAQKELDPLLVKITNFSNAINEKFENRLRDMFKGEQKEELLDKYLALRLERTMRMRELLKTSNSRAANLNVNYEYHNKFYELIGKDLYVKYLKILNETNEEAKKTKIVLEF